MKIGIVTVGGYYNYGNRLQNFALEQVLSERYMADVVSIKHKQHDRARNLPTNLSKIKRLLVNTRFNFFKEQRRVNNFYQFSQSFLHESNDRVVDVAVSGSDQVWNPNFAADQKNLKFLLLDGVEAKRKISYAASIGLNEVDEQFQALLREELPSFDAISVREEQACQIIHDLYPEMKVSVVLDPTMLLTAEQWTKALNLKITGTEKSIFTYFLGDEPKGLQDKLQEFKDAGYKIIQFQNLSPEQRANYDRPPEDFVKEIAQASMVLTDSFHATVFSLIYHVPFLVMQRSGKLDMSSRIDTLLSVANISKKDVFNVVPNINNIPKIDFNSVDENLNHARVASLKYLDTAIL